MGVTSTANPIPGLRSRRGREEGEDVGGREEGGGRDVEGWGGREGGRGEGERDGYKKGMGLTQGSLPILPATSAASVLRSCIK